jgi:CheY-like chemotaxis protein
MLILFLTSDLVFPSRILGVLQSLRGRMETAATADALLTKAAGIARGPMIVLIDLASSAANVIEVVPKLKALASAPAAIIAFGPHVHQEKLEAAKAAGCDLVLTRGQFDAQYAVILKQLAANNSASDEPSGISIQREAAD